MSEAAQPSGPDLTQGVAASQLADGKMLLGHVGEDAVLLARRGDDVFAVGAHCTHYNGPLAEGLLVGDTVRCPLAPRLLQLAHGRSATRARAQSRRVLDASSKTVRQSVVREKSNAGNAGQAFCRGSRRARSSSSGAVRPATRRPRCCGAMATAAPSRCSAPTSAARTTARTCRRTFSPARRPRIGFRCGRPSSTRSKKIDVRLGARVPRSIAPGRTCCSTMAAELRVRRAASGDRCASRAARHSGRRPAARALLAHARRQPRDHRQGEARRRRRRHRCELHRSRGGGVAARARARGACRRPRGASARARAWTGARRLHSTASTRSTASYFTWAQAVARIDGTRRVTLDERRDGSTPISWWWASACARRGACRAAGPRGRHGHCGRRST